LLNCVAHEGIEAVLLMLPQSRPCPAVMAAQLKGAQQSPGDILDLLQLRCCHGAASASSL
jgi:hypothetical protein